MGDNLLNVLEGHQEFKSLLNYYKQDKEGQIIGVDDSSKSFLIANLRESLSENILVITSSLEKADDIYEDLARLLSKDQLMIFPNLEILPHEALDIEVNVKAERLKVLNQLIKNKKDKKIIITPIQSLIEVLIPPELYQDSLLKLEVGVELDVQDFTKKLVEIGYQREDMLEAKGQFSIRGGVVDIYPYTFSQAVRLEFFGDEIESIRYFDLATQLSEKEIERIIIGPANEFLIQKDKLVDAISAIELDAKHELVDKDIEAEEILKNKIEHDLERMKESIYFPEIRQYFSYFYTQSTLLDYFKGSIIVDNPVKIKSIAMKFLADRLDHYSTLLNQGRVLISYKDLYMDFNDIFYKNSNYKFYLSPIKSKMDFIDLDFNLEINSHRLEALQGKMDILVNKLKEYYKNQNKIIIGLSTLSKAKRLRQELQRNKLPATVVDDVSNEIKTGNIILTTANLNNGFVFSDINLVFYTENEIFKKKKRKRKRAKAFDNGVKISSFTDLKPGDYIVHENHGIGKYLGIKTLTIQAKNKDYLVLMYANDDKLYIPTAQVDLIQKYVGLQDKEPKLHKLDGDSWNKAKARVKKSVEEMAEELLELYAKRELKRGYSFGEDTVWQQEFEDSFPYEETLDQKKAIIAVKEDMEAEQPMDRLLCGDVGYGKTEVAIRAIFKAIMDGKQTVFLVPTTILAQQHFNNLVDRFADYPINIGVLSRFRTAAEQRKIIAALAKGSIDLVIGTHRLLSKDIKFKDLGLVVVDEEQRFGVSQKEKLKRLKESVDVLTLTATPIPRTLHMSLVGVRDISLIETPPANRYPIRTYVGEYDDHLIQDAIQREINRGGQVYFVHNRVKDIKEMTARLQSLIPQAKIAIAHGQMSEVKLEELMIDFLNNQYDVLVCTTIIETGMDISNVNTIIINQADHLGLSQLYQLRGRVGRTNRIAYAYLLYKQDKVLSEIAEKRLKAIKEFTSLGSGFKIAMRDLEIRGAGNILGPEQHGHIESIGFSLYCKLLEEAVKRLQNEDLSDEEEVLIDLKVDAYIPNKYIEDAKQKIDIYKKIDAISTLLNYEELTNEIIDRFGTPPNEVVILLELAKLKLLAKKIKAEEIEEKVNKIQVNFSDNHNLSGEELITLSQKFEGLKFSANKKPKIKMKVNNLNDLEKVNLISDILHLLLTAE